MKIEKMTMAQWLEFKSWLTWGERRRIKLLGYKSENGYTVAIYKDMDLDKSYIVEVD